MRNKLYIVIHDNKITLTYGKINKNNIMLEKSIEIDFEHGILAQEDWSNEILDKIKLDINKAEIKCNKAVLGMSTSGIVVRSQLISKIKPKLLDSLINNNIEEYLSTVDTNDYEWRYTIVGESEINGEKQYKVLFTAIEKYKLYKALSLLNKLAIKVTDVDIFPNIIRNLINISNIKSSMVIDSSGLGCKLVLFKEQDIITYIDLPFIIDSIGDEGASNLYGEIKAYMDYYSSINMGDTIEKIIITGELANVEGIKESISRVFEVDTNNNIDWGLALESKDSIRISNYQMNIGLMTYK